jgi:hypothetical protein
MPSPFPGMDPFLEAADLWSDFHRDFVGELHQSLGRGLAEWYEAITRRRQYTMDDTGAAKPYVEDFIEVRERTSGKPVTLIDVLSPANKMADEGRRAYHVSRREGIEAGANLVEVDLILQGRPTLEYSREGLAAWHYAVTLTRTNHRERFEIFTSTLQKRLPRFRLPLSSDDRDMVIDLQTAFARCYDRGCFSSRIDYELEPQPLLAEEDHRWLDETLTLKGLRAPVPPNEQVAIAAYYLWEQEGRPRGRDREHWLEARRQLRKGMAGAPTDVK